MILGQVAKGTHFSDKPGFSQPTYKVMVMLKNVGPNPIAFDSCAVAFQPNGSESYLFGVKIFKGKENKSAAEVLAPGQEFTDDFSTDGFTTDLLLAAFGKPISFRIVFINQGKIVFGPYKANLPLFHKLDFNQPQNLEFMVVKSLKKTM
jgi:hypothetical protein